MLPAERLHESGPGDTRQSVQLSTPREITRELLRRSGESGISPAAYCLAALSVVLYRHTGEGHLDLGFGNACGLVQINLQPGMPFQALAGRVSTACATAQESGRPLTVTFAYGDEASRPADLDFGVTETATEGAQWRLAYNAALHSRATAERLLYHCTVVLAQAVDDPAGTVAAIRLPREDSSGSHWPLPVPAGYVPPRPLGVAESLVARFREVATTQGERLAVSGYSGRLSYAELDSVTDAFAATLSQLVGTSDQRIALLFEHDIGAVTGIWAALKAGITYVPLDPRFPDSHLTRIVADAKVSAIACDPGLAARAAALAGTLPVVCLSASGRSAATAPCPTADALAYLLHTSGSTGRPKGVMQTQRNVLAHALTYATRLRMGPRDCVPLLARFTFDAAVMDLFGALLCGASLHVLDPLRLDPRALWAALRDANATILHCTPTLFRHMVAVADTDGVPSMRAVVLGGEEAIQADLDDFTRAFPSACVLVNGYGPTECTMALQHIVVAADGGHPSLPIGCPVEGVEVELVDDAGNPTEVYGELVIKSPHVALGYWRQPDETARAFGHDANGVPSYRTGDLAYRLPDGRLIFRGRRDHQVKIRGYRVEPAEVERLLRAHPTVGRAAVVVDRSVQTRPILLAYVTASSAMPAQPQELLAYLRRHLPDHLVPAEVIVVDSLPLGPTGKLDRSRLPAPAQHQAPAADDLPQTRLERLIAAHWCELLGHDSVGIRENFFNIGGDSAQAMWLLAKLAELKIDISLPQFLAAPTIESIVKCRSTA